jgi:hypothetical protein
MHHNLHSAPAARACTCSDVMTAPALPNPVQ